MLQTLRDNESRSSSLPSQAFKLESRRPSGYGQAASFPTAAEILARAKQNFAARNRGRVWEAVLPRSLQALGPQGIPLTPRERSEFLEQALHELLSEPTWARRSGRE
jgi:hypothetical protein